MKDSFTGEYRMTCKLIAKSIHRLASNSFVAGFIVLFSLTCCTAWALPHASFTANQTSGCSPLNVQFSNTSTGAVSYYWDFGNGNTSTLPNPSNLYTVAGSYTVVLVATGGGGKTDTMQMDNYITVIGQPTADFNSPSPASCLDNNSIPFTKHFYRRSKLAVGLWRRNLFDVAKSFSLVCRIRTLHHYINSD